MSSDEIQPASLSDSSDDIGFLDEYSTRVASQKAGPSVPPQIKDGTTEPSSAVPTSGVEPDWVRDYTPKRRSDFDRKQALLALLDDDDDDDSVINLISQEPEEEPVASKPDPKTASKTKLEDPQRPPPPKRARAPAKPKSKLPLVVAPKLDDSLVLLQSVDGNLDLSGDIGAVGRVKVEEGALYLDIKGVVYRTSVNPCNTLCVVSVGEDEARVTTVLDEAVTLTSERNLFGSDEVIVHGDLDEDRDENVYYSHSDEAIGESEQKRTGNGKKKKSNNMNGKRKSKTNSTGKSSQEPRKRGIAKPPRRKK